MLHAYCNIFRGGGGLPVRLPLVIVESGESMSCKRKVCPRYGGDPLEGLECLLLGKLRRMSKSIWGPYPFEHRILQLRTGWW